MSWVCLGSPCPVFKQGGPVTKPAQFMVPAGTNLHCFHCEHCDSDTPWWRILRRGDAVVSWACFGHLPEVCMALQRPDEKTELVVTEHAP